MTNQTTSTTSTTTITNNNNTTNNNNNNNNNTTNNKYTGLSGFWYSIQLRRIKARHECDPFSLTKEELEILKEDITQRCFFKDKQNMETKTSIENDNDNHHHNNNKISSNSNATTTRNNNHHIGWRQSIEAAVLVPEAFAAYTERLVDSEGDGADNMGMYKSVPLGADIDIDDDFELKMKKMKPMKIKGDDDDDVVTSWGDVADAIMDSTTINIDDNQGGDDPLGTYKGVPLSWHEDDIDNNDNNGDVTGIEMNREEEELRIKVMKLSDQVERLQNELRTKCDECELWKLKAIQLEDKLKQLELNNDHS